MSTSETHDQDRVTDRAADRARDIVDQTRQQTQEVAHAAREAAQQAGGRVREGAKATVAEMKGRAADAGSELRARGEAYFGEQKSRAADEASHLSEAVRCAAERLHEEQDEHLAGYADSLAQQIDRVSDYLRERDMRDLLNDAQAFARRRPEVVLGGMFVAGLVAARFLKASSEAQETGSAGQPGLYDEHDLEREAALDADASSVGSRLPGEPAAGMRAFEPGGFSTGGGGESAGGSSVPGSAPSSTYNPSPGGPGPGPEGPGSPSGWGSVNP